jgi:hypothetical protein
VRWRVWLLVGLAACRFGFDRRAPDGNGSSDALLDDGGTPIPPFEPYWTSGTRLRARLLAPVEGGDPYFLDWYDTLIGTACTSAVSADGVERCIAQDQRTEQLWADAACTVPLAWVRPATCSLGHFAQVVDTSGRYHVHPVGAVYTGQLYSQDTGPCLAVTPPAEGEVHSLDAELPASMFVPTQYMNVPVGDYARPTQGHVDGSAVEIGALLAAPGSCFPIAKTLGPSPCVATAPEGTAVYLDLGCTARAYLWRRDSFDPPTTTALTVPDPTDACEHTYELIQITADVTTTSHYEQTATGCTLTATGAGNKLYTGTPSTDVYPTGNLVIGARRGRLGYLYWIGSDNIPLTTRYWDHELHMPCRPINGTDGKLRCLPAQLPTIDAHPNMTCGATAVAMTPACFGSAPVEGTTYNSCQDYRRVRTLPSLGTTASVFADTCTPLSVQAGFYDQSQPGAELPPSMFAELKEVIE